MDVHKKWNNRMQASLIGSFEKRTGQILSSLIVLAAISVFLILSIATSAASADFNTEEADWIEQHPVVTLAIDNTCPPLNFISEEGKMTGLIVDMVDTFSAKAGIRVDYHGSIWPTAIKRAMNRNVDGVVNADATEERKMRLNFTIPYATLPCGLVTLNRAPNLEAIGDLNDRVICATNNSSHLELLVKKTKANILPVETLEKGLEQVLKKEAFGVFGDVSVLGFLIARYNFVNLKINFLHYDDVVGVSRLGLRNNDQVLLSVFNKAISSLTKAEKDEIQSRWLSVTKERTVIERRFDWALFFKIAGPVLALGLVLYLLVLLHNHRLKREVETRTHDLRKSEEQYRRIFENSVAGFFQSTPEGRFVSVNQAFAKILNYNSPEDLVESITDIATQYYVNPDDRKHYQQILQRNGKVDGYEHKARSKDGSTKWVSSSARAYFDDTGIAYRYEGVINDITARKAAEDAQRETEDRLSQIIMGSPVPTLVVDNRHVTTHWNKALETISNIPAAAVIGTNRQWQAFYADQRPVLADLIVDNASEDELSRYYAGKISKSPVIENAYVAEHFFPDMGQGGRWLFFTAAPLRNMAGEIIGAVETLQDISERKEFEQSLRESEQRYRSLFEAANDAIFILKDGRFVDCNPKTLEQFKCKREQLFHNYPFDFSPEFQPDGSASKDKALAFINQALNGDFQFFPWKHRRHDGSLFDAEVGLSRFDLGGEPHVLALLRDVTDRIESEKRLNVMEKRLFQSQKMEAIGTLAGGIAHDFNNILSAIIGYAELLQMHLPVNGKEWDYTQQIQMAGGRAKELVQQILTFSRQSEIELKPVQISVIVKEVIKLIRSTLPTTIQIRQNVQGQSLVMGDPTQIHQILMNLCTNAGHAMHEQGGLLTIELSRIDHKDDFVGDRNSLKPGAYVQLSISDTGQGIPANLIDRVFEPFFTTKQRGEGTGMGLSVVHGIVTSYNGTICVNSEEGQGTTFKVFLPAIEHSVEKREYEVEAIPRGSERVLFVDDESILVEMVKSQLEGLGYIVSARSNSLEALALFENKPDNFDLVITDMTMPGMTGDELAKKIKRIRPDIPIILCTGFSTKITPDTAHRFDIDALLMKPVILGKIAKTTRHLLDKKYDG